MRYLEKGAGIPRNVGFVAPVIGEVQRIVKGPKPRYITLCADVPGDEKSRRRDVIVQMVRDIVEADIKNGMDPYGVAEHLNKLAGQGKRLSEEAQEIYRDAARTLISE